MRRIFFSLLILLTAFRGVVGDAMAYGMTSGMMQRASQSVVAPESIAAHADSMRASKHFDAEKSAAMPCHEMSADAASADASASSCTTCQVCHLAVSLPSAGLVSGNILPVCQLHAAHASSWQSAELQRNSKPPIL